MNQITSTTEMSRLYLMFYILLCSVFMCENTFSIRYWQKSDTQIDYNQREGFITFDFLIFQNFYIQDKIGYLDWCDFYYSEDSENYLKLMRVSTKDSKGTGDVARILMMDKKPNETIQLLNSLRPKRGMIWPEGKNLDVDLKIKIEDIKGQYNKIVKMSTMSVKWYLLKSCKSVQSIKIIGYWGVNDESRGVRIEEIYPMKIKKLNSNSLKNDSSVLKSKISKNVMVTGKTDAIILSGADPGDEIKVYNIAGVEVISVVATDDIVNIKLAKNQMYIVKTGQKRHKVTL